MVGSHRKYRRGGAMRIFAHHDGVDLGGPALARIAEDYGVQLDELRRMLWMMGPEMAVQSRIRVEFFFDPEYRLWHYAVNEPDLPGINGGGLPTLDEARQHAAEVIAQALRSDDKPPEQAGGHVEYLPLVVG